MLSREATNTNFKVFGLTRPWIEPTTLLTQGEHLTNTPPSRSGFNNTYDEFYFVSLNTFMYFGTYWKLHNAYTDKHVYRGHPLKKKQVSI